MHNNKTVSFINKTGKKYADNMLFGVFFVFLTTVLYMFGLPLLWMMTAFLALVHLRHDISQSGPLALVAIFIIFGFSGSFISALPVLSVMIAAEVYKKFGSLMLSFEALIAIGLVIVLLVHLFYPEIASFWLTRFEPIKALVLKEQAIDAKQIEQAFESMSKVATGLSVMSSIFHGMLGLILGAIWQASIQKQRKVYNEILNARMGLTVPILCLLGIAAWLIKYGWMVDLLPVIIGSLSFYGMYVFICVSWYLFKKPIWVYIMSIVGVFLYMRFDIFKIFIVLIAVTDYFANWREIFKKVSVDTK